MVLFSWYLLIIRTPCSSFRSSHLDQHMKACRPKSDISSSSCSSVSHGNGGGIARVSLCGPVWMICAVVRARERLKREKLIQEEHKEQRVKTVMALKRDLEVNEVTVSLHITCLC